MQTSQLVAIVCGNCLIGHTPEDCIVTSFTTSDSTNLVDVVSISDDESCIGEPIYFTNDEESNIGEPIYFTNNDENVGLPTMREVTYSYPWSESESSDGKGS